MPNLRCYGHAMVSLTGNSPLLSRREPPFPNSETRNPVQDLQIPSDRAVQGGLRAVDAAEHRKRLERRLQAQLSDGGRSKDVKRLGDPLVRHLLRVAGNASYRSAAWGDGAFVLQGRIPRCFANTFTI